METDAECHGSLSPRLAAADDAGLGTAEGIPETLRVSDRGFR
jgi:hypothetical protein